MSHSGASERELRTLKVMYSDKNDENTVMGALKKTSTRSFIELVGFWTFGQRSMWSRSSHSGERGTCWSLCHTSSTCVWSFAATSILQVLGVVPCDLPLYQSVCVCESDKAWIELATSCRRGGNQLVFSLCRGCPPSESLNGGFTAIFEINLVCVVWFSSWWPLGRWWRRMNGLMTLSVDNIIGFDYKKKEKEIQWVSRNSF